MKKITLNVDHKAKKQYELKGEHHMGRYGPRESDRREAFSTTGRLQCDLKLATFATRQRGKPGQVSCTRETLRKDYSSAVLVPGRDHGK